MFNLFLAVISLLSVSYNKDDSQPDTFVREVVIQKENNGVSSSFRNSSLKGDWSELAYYLDSLNLSDVVTKAKVTFYKSLTTYEPTFGKHHGQPWYTFRGRLVDQDGDENLLQDVDLWEKGYPKVLEKMAKWRLERHWGPYVLYDNEDGGKGVYDVEVDLLDSNDEVLVNLHLSFYRLPQGDGVDLDNVDAGNENHVVVMSGFEGRPLFSLGGGTGPTYFHRGQGLREEFDKLNDLLDIMGKPPVIKVEGYKCI